MNVAALKGHTHVCQYLRSEQCPWGPAECFNAARGGHLCTLRWLHDAGCPRDLRAVRFAAARFNHLSILMYMQGVQPAASSAQLTQVLNIAGAYDKLSIAQWRRQQGAEWPAVLRFDGFSWRTDVLQCVREEGCTSPVQALTAAVLAV
jgi:hypothetical protein